MSVSKRLRFEILRRDNHTCRYCGGTAPDVKLTVDHVLAVALGGSDDASNLVAACKDCNAGKAASNPDEPLLDQVSEAALRWAKAVKIAADEALGDFYLIHEARELFINNWNTWGHDGGRGRQRIPLPVTWPNTVDMLCARGLPVEILEECVRLTMTRAGIAVDQRFKYFCGIAWTKVRQIDKAAHAIYTFDDPDMPDAEMIR